MRIGLVGPAQGNVEAFHRAAELLLGELGVDLVIYLGIDDVVDALAHRFLDDGNTTSSFEDRAVEVALDGNADAIAALLEADRQTRRLESIRCLPAPPARSIELLDDRIVLFVHDKAVLDEEDIANVHVIVFGLGKEMVLRKIGPRIFFCPGPLSDGHLGVIELEDEGRVAITAYDADGDAVAREVVANRTVKISVSS